MTNEDLGLKIAALKSVLRHIRNILHRRDDSDNLLQLIDQALQYDLRAAVLAALKAYDDEEARPYSTAKAIADDIKAGTFRGVKPPEDD